MKTRPSETAGTKRPVEPGKPETGVSTEFDGRAHYTPKSTPFKNGEPNDGTVTEDETGAFPATAKHPSDAIITSDPIDSRALGTHRFIDRLKEKLSRTRQILSADIDKLFSGERKIDSDLFEALEELLITSDIGVRTSVDLIDRISKHAAPQPGPDLIKELLKKEFRSILNRAKPGHTEMSEKPEIVMVVGVNGVGKTTTIGKLAAKYNASGKKVLIAAADTFRAAAEEQLAIWSERAGADLVKSKPKSDPAAVAYDSIEAALARDIDIVLIDTAGRLHTKINLMEELKKIKRTIARKLPLEPREILLVLDATTGQNALHQAEMFNEALGVTGIAMTKLDGTAKGGIVIPICNELKIPLKYIGIGETIADLQVFEPKQFIDALL